MARGVSFAELIGQLKEELDLSTNVGVGVDKRPMLMRAINRAYASLYRQHDWPHLRIVTERRNLSAGERFYDFPEDIDYERVEKVHIWWNDNPYDLVRGIGVREYAQYDPENEGLRYDPAMRWDTQWKDTNVQYEVWPVPASNNQQIQFTGIKKFAYLVNDEDQCLLDSEIVVLFAAARFLARSGSEDAKLALAEAQESLSRLKAHTGPSEPIRMGLGTTARDIYPRTTVRISG